MVQAIFVDKNYLFNLFFFHFPFGFNHSHSCFYRWWCDAQLRLCVETARCKVFRYPNKIIATCCDSLMRLLSHRFSSIRNMKKYFLYDEMNAAFLSILAALFRPERST